MAAFNTMISNVVKCPTVLVSPMSCMNTLTYNILEECKALWGSNLMAHGHILYQAGILYFIS